MGDLIRIDRIVELPIKTMDDIARENEGLDLAECLRAMPQAARAATPSEPSLLRVSGQAGIAIAVFCIIYFALEFLR